jgi:uncharacterized protein involved in propanediol utilization
MSLTGNAARSTNSALWGEGSCCAHHGELLQGAFELNDQLVRGLVTLPCSLMSAHARACLRPGSGHVSVVPSWKRKAARAAELALAHVSLADWDAEVTLTGDIPTARGFGSSTADVTATIRAVMSATSRSISHADLGHIAVEAETASDPLMLDSAVLFAQRRGHAIQRLGPALPNLVVVGFGSGSSRAPGVDTLSFPPARYTAAEIGLFRTLRAAMARACRNTDAVTVGWVATQSAWINQSYLPVPRLDLIHAIADAVGAVGIQVAHSGDIAGLLFAAPDADLESRTAECQARLGELGIGPTWHFAIGAAARDGRVVDSELTLGA